ncbi:hypothetical protein ACNKHM_14295 [Shigella sonnei]
MLSEPGASAIDRILKLIEEAEECRDPSAVYRPFQPYHASDHGRRPAERWCRRCRSPRAAGVDL